MTPRISCRLACTLILASLSLHAATAHGESVREVAVERAVASAALVVEGLVVEVRSVASPDGEPSRYPWTRVMLQVIDVIKAAPGQEPAAGRRLALHFLGGTLGDVRLVVSDMQVPAVGEHGIFFIEAPGRRQVHPLYGWSQGRFRVLRDARGVQRVTTANGEPVQWLNAGGQRESRALSKGKARGVRTTSALTSAMTPMAVKQRLRQMLTKAVDR